MDQSTPQIDSALAAYFAGQATAEEFRAIEAWINASPANARDFLDQLRFRELLGEHLREQANDTGAVLAELARIEAQAQPEVVTIRTDGLPDETADHDHDPAEMSAREIASVVGYLFRQALVSRPALYAYAAAVVLLVGALLIPWGDTNPPPQTAQTNTNNTKPAASAQPTPRGSTPTPQTVATLTAAHNALWAEGASAPGSLTVGSKLHPNQRLTLTAGLAEITTTRGAVAILEAPTTIELLNNNALRLHTGKLVGICETEQSHGFLVRTPHMDITDLGTRFGVEAVRGLATEVHVHQGKVIVSMPVPQGSSYQPKQVVTADQAVRTRGIDSKTESIATNFNKFDTALRTIRLRGTGFGLAEGVVDPNWQIVADANGSLDTPLPVTVQRSTHAHYPAVGNDPSRAQWLFFLTSFNDLYYPFHTPKSIDSTRLTFASNIEVPDDLDLNNKALFLRYASNDNLHAISINGQPIAGLSRQGMQGEQVIFHKVQIPIEQTALGSGKNTIHIEVNNARTPNIANLYLAWDLRPAAESTPPAGEQQP